MLYMPQVPWQLAQRGRIRRATAIRAVVLLLGLARLAVSTTDMSTS